MVEYIDCSIIISTIFISSFWYLISFRNMGIMSKTTINRILCSPCSFFIWALQKAKCSFACIQCYNQKLHSLLPAIMVMFLVTWFFSHSIIVWAFSTVKSSIERSETGRTLPQDESFLVMYNRGVTREGTDVGEGPNSQVLADTFSQGNFLDLKLRHVISLAYLGSSLQSSPKQKLGLDSLSTPGKPLYLSTNFSYLLDELDVILKVQNFYLRHWGCRELESLSKPNAMFISQHSETGNVVFEEKNVSLQTSIVDTEELVAAKCGYADSDSSRCFFLKNRRMLQQYLYLQQLSHPNIVKLYGVCISTKYDNSVHGVIMAKEAGIKAETNKMRSLPWAQRLKISYDLVNLAYYLSTSPFGSIRLENWSPQHFVVIPVTYTIKLSNFDQTLKISEPSCKTDRDCSVENVHSATKCVGGSCKGYNEKVNLLNIYKSFIKPILEHEIPTRISDDVKKVLYTLNQLQCNSTLLLSLLKFLSTSSQDVAGLQQDLPNKEVIHIGGLKRIRDGMQVDSWEQHESHVAINEVDFNQILIDQNNNQQDINNVGQEDQDDLKDTFGYKKIENADFPGRYDYYCPHSKAEWGCVVSLRKLEEAAKKCDNDEKCKAFVTMPHLRKEGWIIAILKSDNPRAVDHAGTTVYIKVSGVGNAQNEKNEKDSLDNRSSVVKLCLQDIVDAQEAVRETQEHKLMKACGWVDMTDSKWQSAVLESTIKDASAFKPSRGKMAVGGQMNVMLEVVPKLSTALFMAKKGPQEYHLAQLTTFYLDRMLGLFKTVPSFLRTLTEQEMTDAGFPVDIGGNQFDVFRSLKNPDKSLSGTLIPVVSGRVGVEHYISVPKLNQITNAVTPFSRRQWDDLEYLLLMWLASLPFPSKGHPSVQGLLVHIKTEEAFKTEPSPVVLLYFNNCQFPRIAIDVLRSFRSSHCNFGDQLVARVRTAYADLQQNAFTFQVPVADVATRNANRLLEVVDSCVRKFGENVVLYES